MFNSMSLAAYSQVSTLAAKNGDTINLKKSWETFFGAIEQTSGFGRILNLLSIIGVVLVAFAVVKWAWDRRRGLNGGGSGAIWGALLIGAILSAPNLLIPIVLQIFDLLVNSISKIWGATK